MKFLKKIFGRKNNELGLQEIENFISRLEGRVAVASLGKKLEDGVASMGARAPYFLIFENGKLIEAVKNPFVAGGGAGLAVSKLLKDKGVNVFVAKKIGENMKKFLTKEGIEIKIVQDFKVLNKC